MFLRKLSHPIFLAAMCVTGLQAWAQLSLSTTSLSFGAHTIPVRVRPEDAYDWLGAIPNYHVGLLATVNANSPRNAMEWNKLVTKAVR